VNPSISPKGIVSGVLILGAGLVGVLFLAAPNVLFAGIISHQDTVGLRLLGALLLVVSMISALCAWAASAGRQRPAHAEASVQGVYRAADTHGVTPGLDRWQMLPWICSITVGLSAASYLVAFTVLEALSQNGAVMSGADRDKVLITPVILFVLSWPAAAAISVICLVRALVIKARGGASGNIASPLFGALVCGLLFLFWCLALMGFLQYWAPP
jgi:hypothetical protein